jgi:hypothetical protein
MIESRPGLEAVMGVFGLGVPIPAFRRACASFMLLAILLFSGCSTQRLYDMGQSWQRNNCNRFVEDSERARCKANADVPYATFERQVKERGQ